MNTELTLSELDDQRVELLPARETLNYYNYGCCCPSYYASVWASNQSIALNVDSARSFAQSAAVQNVQIG